ncbi:excalibur calcium-binding domain-containing protein [Shewanella avicenniae]|uniref:Excalibur calcium-binding domain-containing protein n=1 Tax=Shewanella avicenniae TaxID=2814294 RepID=A0ABX7QS66_9GAMM|nr:excalibur calcium-binding domain-containing protein [Shewanella avicenniae]QSX33531.1 excalibur calcium-binding domain-containing protein [Shewanella avicenniae]
MKRLLFYALLIYALWMTWERFGGDELLPQSSITIKQEVRDLINKEADKLPKYGSQNNFRCDGRKYCSEMRSREEAEFFLKNCPDTRMDSDNDGIPCENDSRW